MTDPRHEDLFAAIDDALAGTDLQNSTEPAGSVGQGCCRCTAPTTDSADFCEGCRAFLLGDTDVDPRRAYEAQLPAFAARARQWAAGTDLAAGLDAGHLHLLTEAGEWVTGPEAVALVEASLGR